MASSRATPYAARVLLRWLLVLLLALTAACSQEETPTPPPAASLGTYWLEDVQLLDSDQARGALVYEGRPFLIRADRSVEDATTGAPLGLLPERLMKVPAERGGVLLYARELTPIHLDKPDGKQVGRLFPGARVSVTPGVDGSTELGQLGFERAEAPLKREHRSGAFASHSSLSARQLKAQPFPTVPCGIVTRVGEGFGWNGFVHRSCDDVVYDPKTKQAVQRHAGIEIEPDWADHRFDHAFLSRPGFCGTSSITRTSDGLMLTPRVGWPKRQPRPVDAIPAAFTPVQAPLPDPLAPLLRRKGKLYWMMQYPEHVACEEWSVREPAEATPLSYHYGAAEERLAREPSYRWRDQLRGELVRTDPIFPGEPPYYPFTYWSPTLRDVARVQLEPVRNGCSRCWQQAFYGLVDSEGETLYLQAFAPRNPVAYDRPEAERWFLTRRACDAALEDAQRRLALDGSLQNQLGFRLEPFLPAKSGTW